MNKENYRRIYEPINSTLYSVQNDEYKWGVVDEKDNIIVEFGKYAWIDGFQNWRERSMLGQHEDRLRR